jgi:adenine-specific DNA methylase
LSFDHELLPDEFYQYHDFTDKVVADPFMGGGSPLIEASHLGMDVIGSDINPMAYWIVRQSLASLDIFQFTIEAQRVAKAVEDDLGHLYKAQCKECGGDADMK